MLTLYRLLATADADARSAVLTVIEGRDFGDKCLLSSGALQWERDEGGFFARNIGAIRDIDGQSEACSGAYQAPCGGKLPPLQGRREANPLGCGTLEIDGQQVFCEPLGREKTLVVCGGGHVAIPVVRIARLLGMPVTVLEDRPAFAQKAQEAGAERVICAPFEEALKQIPGGWDTFFVIVTRGHGSDIKCLDAVSRKPHAYIGMIGSRRRVALVKKHLIEDRGCDPAVIEGVHMPIGLDIGAETPEEIAVSIMAEIIREKNRAGRNAFWSRELLQAIIDPSAHGVPKALATVVERRGSAPRGPGARMLVWPDGRTLDTVGGGSVEGEVIRAACRRLQAGEREPCLYKARLDADAAAEDGMACGGEVTVLIEAIAADRG